MKTINQVRFRNFFYELILGLRKLESPTIS